MLRRIDAHAQMNMCSFPRRPSVVIAVGIGKPIRNAGGAMMRKQHTSRAPYGSPPIASRRG